MKSFVKSYNKLSWIVKLILAIIPPTAWIVQGIYRIARGKVLAGLLYLLLPCWLGIGYIIDIVTVVLNKKPTFFA